MHKRNVQHYVKYESVVGGSLRVDYNSGNANMFYQNQGQAELPDTNKSQSFTNKVKKKVKTFKTNNNNEFQVSELSYLTQMSDNTLLTAFNNDDSNLENSENQQQYSSKRATSKHSTTANQSLGSSATKTKKVAFAPSTINYQTDDVFKDIFKFDS